MFSRPFFVEEPLHREHPPISLVPTRKSDHPEALTGNGVKMANENPLGSTSKVYADVPTDGALKECVGLS